MTSFFLCRRRSEFFFFALDERSERRTRFLFVLLLSSEEQLLQNEMAADVGMDWDALLQQSEELAAGVRVRKRRERKETERERAIRRRLIDDEQTNAHRSKERPITRLAANSFSLSLLFSLHACTRCSRPRSLSSRCHEINQHTKKRKKNRTLPRLPPSPASSGTFSRSRPTPRRSARGSRAPTGAGTPQQRRGCSRTRA